MYTSNHAMIPIVPPHGTQIIGSVDGSYMFIFDRSIRQNVCTFLEGVLDAARAVTEKAPIASSGTTPLVVKGSVLKGDMIFPMLPIAAPAKLDETVHVDLDVAAAMKEANNRGFHKDTEPAPPPEPSKPVHEAELVL